MLGLRFPWRDFDFKKQSLQFSSIHAFILSTPLSYPRLYLLGANPATNPTALPENSRAKPSPAAIFLANQTLYMVLMVRPTPCRHTWSHRILRCCLL